MHNFVCSQCWVHCAMQNWAHLFPNPEVTMLISERLLEVSPAFCTFGTPTSSLCMYTVDAATSSGILKAKQKLGVTFNSDKLGGIDFTKFSKLSMCSAGAGRCWLVQWPGLPPRHCTWSVLKFL